MFNAGIANGMRARVALKDGGTVYGCVIRSGNGYVTVLADSGIEHLARVESVKLDNGK